MLKLCKRTDLRGLLLLASMYAFLCCPAPVLPKSPTVFAAKVINVESGNIIDVRADDDGMPLQVILFAIDAPTPPQAFGTQSASYLKAILESTDNHIQLQRMRDLGAGRIVAKVILWNDVYVNALQVRLGMAWWDCRGKQECNQLDLKKIQQVAKNNQWGVWSEQNPIRPRYFRMIQKLDAECACE